MIGASEQIPSVEETVESVGSKPSSNGNAGIVKRSDSLGALASALAKAQLEFQPVIKDTENPYYRSRYADLSTIIAATQKALAKNEIVIIQAPIVNVERQHAGVSSLMVHSSGEWMESELILPATMLGKDGKPRFDAQSCGSAQTYARRYTYQSLIGVAAETDDDANSSVGIGSREAAQAVAQKKIAEAKERAEETAPVGENAALFYVWFEESQTAEITGHKGLLKVNSDLLKRFWNATAKAIVVNAEQLEQLKFELERRGVIFRPLKAAQ